MGIGISDSANQAQAILRAWQSGDLPRFRWEVEAVASLVPPAANTLETERIDLLNGVAGELRVIKHPLADPNTHFCRYLLLHLAGAANMVSTDPQVGTQAGTRRLNAGIRV
jgi:hypothetical protein